MSFEQVGPVCELDNLGNMAAGRPNGYFAEDQAGIGDECF